MNVDGHANFNKRVEETRAVIVFGAALNRSRSMYSMLYDVWIERQSVSGLVTCARATSDSLRTRHCSLAPEVQITEHTDIPQHRAGSMQWIRGMKIFFSWYRNHWVDERSYSMIMVRFKLFSENDREIPHNEIHYDVLSFYAGISSIYCRIINLIGIRTSRSLETQLVTDWYHIDKNLYPYKPLFYIVCTYIRWTKYPKYMIR